MKKLILLLIFLNSLTAFSQIVEIKNYLQNGNFENCIGYGSRTNFYIEPIWRCYDTTVKNWLVCGSPDLYSREAPRFFPIPFYKIPSYYNPPLRDWLLDYTPDTYDSNSTNNFYVGFALVSYDTFRRGEYITQKINLIDYDSYYVFEGYAHSNYFVFSRNVDFMSHHFRDSKLLAYLDYDRPDLNYANSYPYDSLYKPLARQQIIFDDIIPTNKWIHFKSKPFKVKNQDLKWIVIGADPRNLPYLNNDRFGLDFYIYVDDLILRPASVGITSTVDRLYPCIGDTVNINIELWKDHPEFNDTLELINDLPGYFEYVSGDFEVSSDTLRKIVTPQEFNEEDKAFFQIKAKVIDDKSYPAVNETYFKGVIDENKSSFGRHKLTMYPGAAVTRIEKAVSKPICRNMPFEIIINIYNEIDQINQIDVYEILSDNIKIIDSTLLLNGKRPAKGINSFQYINAYNANLNFYAINLMPKGEKGSNIQIAFFVNILDSGNVITSLTKVNSNTGCEMYNLIEEEIQFPGVKTGLPRDTVSCNAVELIVDPKYHCLWSNGEKSNSIIVDSTSVISLTAYDDYGCSKTDTSFIFIEKQRSIRLDPEKAAIGKPNDTIAFNLIINPFQYDLKRKRNYSFILEFDDNFNLYSSTFGFNRIPSQDGKISYKADGFFKDSPKEYVIEEFILKAKNSNFIESFVSVKNFILDDCILGLDDAKCIIKLEYNIEGIHRIDSLLNINDKIAVYPNPVEDKANIYIELDEISNIDLAIFDLTGKRIKNIASGLLSKGVYETTFDVSSISAGEYILYLLINNDSAVKKFTHKILKL